MTNNAPRVMEASDAADALAKALGGRGTPRVANMTIADASAKSGLPLWDAERALHALVSEYRGHLRVTAEGDLLFRFPTGLTKPWETRTAIQNALGAVGHALLGVGRFVVRAWVSIVLIAYVLIFVALLIGLAAARSGDSRDRGSSGFGLGTVLLRVIADALFWTFHPFSPFAYSYYDAPARGVSYGYGRQQGYGQIQEEPKTPFYEKVNRFFFGPETPKPDPREKERLILAEIRAQRGRIGLADVMRVTGLPRDEADPMMARLMLEYGGTVDVSDEGGLVYRFKEIRKTAEDPALAAAARPEPVWQKKTEPTPLTGNGFGANFLIILLNGFNLLVSLWALGANLTISRVSLLLQGVPWPKLPPTGTAIALGVVPLVFSIALFALPLFRALWQPFKARRAARENGRKALLRTVLSGVKSKQGVRDEDLIAAWTAAAGTAPDSKTISKEVVALGGDVDLEAAEKGIRYRFPDLEAEAKAVEAEREAAAEDEARVGQVIFSSEN
ncbi:MAG: hypothetical protein U0441_17065 [Polyangiaceae bacterium]